MGWILSGKIEEWNEYDGKKIYLEYSLSIIFVLFHHKLCKSDKRWIKENAQAT